MSSVGKLISNVATAIFGGGASPPPPPPALAAPPPPSPVEAVPSAPPKIDAPAAVKAGQDAAQAARNKVAGVAPDTAAAAGATGMSGTILTSPQGLISPASTGQKTLLGA